MTSLLFTSFTDVTWRCFRHSWATISWPEAATTKLFSSCSSFPGFYLRVVTFESNIKLVRFINTLLLNTLSYFLSLKVSNCYSQDDVEDFHSCYASQGKIRFIWSSKILYLKSSIFQLDHSQIDIRFCLNVKCVSKELQELVRRSFLSPMNLFLFSTFWLSPLNRLPLAVF